MTAGKGDRRREGPRFAHRELTCTSWNGGGSTPWSPNGRSCSRRRDQPRAADSAPCTRDNRISSPKLSRQTLECQAHCSTPSQSPAPCRRSVCTTVAAACPRFPNVLQSRLASAEPTGRWTQSQGEVAPEASFSAAARTASLRTTSPPLPPLEAPESRFVPPMLHRLRQYHRCRRRALTSSASRLAVKTQRRLQQLCRDSRHRRRPSQAHVPGRRWCGTAARRVLLVAFSASCEYQWPTPRQFRISSGFTPRIKSKSHLSRIKWLRT